MERNLANWRKQKLKFAEGMAKCHMELHVWTQMFKKLYLIILDFNHKIFWKFYSQTSIITILMK